MPVSGSGGGLDSLVSSESSSGFSLSSLFGSAGAGAAGGAGAGAGASDPVTAIANAVGAIYNFFGGFTQKTIALDTNKTNLLLASQPQRPRQNNMELYFFIGIMVLLALVILFKVIL